MAEVYNYSKARQNLAAVLEQAAREGEVRIKRKWEEQGAGSREQEAISRVRHVF
ncbi:MAG: hypothetical protein ACLQVJ_03480 [Syntrophobacteraceae bacterium]